MIDFNDMDGYTVLYENSTENFYRNGIFRNYVSQLVEE